MSAPPQQEPPLTKALREFREIIRTVRAACDAAETAHFHALQARMSRPDQVAQGLETVQRAAAQFREALQHAVVRLDDLAPPAA